MKQKYVWKSLVYFFLMMAILTLFSRISASMTVARVQLKTPEKQVLTHQVTADGKVTEAQELPVFTEPNQKISRVMVEEDQSVEAGEVLFQVEEKMLHEQILTCRQELQYIQLELRDLKSQAKIDALQKAKSRLRAREDLEEAVRAGEEEVSFAAFDLENARNALDDFYQDLPDVMDKEEGEAKEEEERALLNSLYDAEKAYEQSLAEQEKGIRAAKRVLEDTEEKLPVNSSLKQKRIEKKQKKALLAKLEKLSQAQGKVTAPVRGIVTGLNLRAGDLTTEQAVILLADLSFGCRFVAEVEENQGKYLEKGALVTLEHRASGKKVENLTVDSVKESPEDDSLLEVRVKIPGENLRIGSTAQMTVESRLGTFDTCIPVKALYESNNGHYVYVAEEKEGILGSQLMVRKVQVQVEDKNASIAALAQGCLSPKQKVVVEASREIGDGSVVREGGINEG